MTRPAPPRELRRPIDTFFVSLAEAQSDNAVCIVLSGGGSDGSAGLVAIKEHGGLTLAQAEADSKAKLGMPSSAAATGLVDEVLPVEAMPQKLVDYAHHLGAMRDSIGEDGAPVGAAENLTKICRIVRNLVGHDFSQYKDKTLLRRVQRRMQVLHVDTMAEYVQRLRSTPGEVRLLFQEFLIGVTDFFRDAEAFAALDAQALPDLINGKTADDQIRVWVAGCATGEEAYSIAILIKESIGRRDGAPKVQVFATDIDEQAIAFARAGRYRLDQIESVSLARREKWFAQENGYWCPIKDIREVCVFSMHSPLKDPPFSKLDLIVCRNLLIYLQPPAQDRLMGAFQYALRRGGYLFLGASESVARTKAFAVIDKKHRIYQRKDSPAASVPVLTAPVQENPSLPVPRAAATEDRLDIDARRAMELPCLCRGRRAYGSRSIFRARGEISRAFARCGEPGSVCAPATPAETRRTRSAAEDDARRAVRGSEGYFNRDRRRHARR